MRVGHQARAVPCQLWPQVGALVASKPKRMRRYRWIGTPDHLKLQVGHQAFERKIQMIDKVISAKAAQLLAAEQSEHHGALGTWPRSQRARQLQHRSDARSVVIGPVVDGIAVRGLIRASSQMI